MARSSVTRPEANLLDIYVWRVREILQAGPTNPEQALAPTFHELLNGLLLKVTASPLIIVPEYAKPGIGRPDIALKRAGQNARAFVELKAPNKPIDPRRFRDPHDRAQFERFKALPIWALSNFSKIRVFRRDELIDELEIISASALNLELSDRKVAELLSKIDIDALAEGFRPLALAEPPPAPDAKALATNLAHASKLVRNIVTDRLAELSAEQENEAPLIAVREEFREVLYAHPEAGGYSADRFDPLFAAAFAQTLAFGLLLAREATNGPIDQNAWQVIPEHHALMRATLRVLSQVEILEEIGIGFDIIIDCVNSFDAAIIAREEGKPDPILYFYEDFLATFNPEERERYGVYYTPVEVVSYIVGALDRALRDDLGLDGFADPHVTILDPAVGTGTFLIGLADRLRADVMANAGPGMVASALRSLTDRIFGFECLVGPYAVAHYRLTHALGAMRNDKRVGIYLADTLAEPGAAAPAGRLGFVAENIRRERRDADRIKSRHSILAILGNPPYRRLEVGETQEIVGNWMNEIWDDLKAPVRDAGWGNQLNTFPELSIAFWRWALWKMFESEGAPQRGIVAFITNRTFLAGRPYAGLRAMLRERFDRIEIIDLRGDVRRGERAGVVGDQGVFNIQVGTAITLAIATGQKPAGTSAAIFYTDTWEQGLFSRESKLAWLRDGADAGALSGRTAINRGKLDNFRPVPFQNYNWPSLDRNFVFKNSGMQTKRDHFVYATSEKNLIEKIRKFHSSNPSAAEFLFHSSRDRSSINAWSTRFDGSLIRRAGYRPLDVRFYYHNRLFVDFMRPDLQAAWGSDNVGLYTLTSGVGYGPAIWAFGFIPDNNSFRGSYGGYAFPLRDHRPGHGPFNIDPRIVAGLSVAYAEAVRPDDIFDAMLCLLSASSYTTRFAEDLEDAFPHVPFPADRTIFHQAVAVGRQIRAVETFARAPRREFLNARVARVETEPRGSLSASDWSDEGITLCAADGSGHVSGIPRAVWNFEVSGYRVLPRWLGGRAGLVVDHELLNEFRDLVGRIAELLNLFAQADEVLIRALESTLSNGDLGLGP
jgi:hypothetical protein